MFRSFVVLSISVALGVLAYLSYQGGLSSFTSTDQPTELPFKKSKDGCNVFKDIVLVIVYNYPYYDSIHLLRQLYEPVFPKLFICGPQGNTSVENVTQVPINRGIFGYHCLAEAIRRHPGYEGYFYINDDVILNYWNLLKGRFDKQIIWRSNNQFGKINLLENLTQPWYWWVSPYGVNNTKNAIRNIQKLGTKFKMYKDMFLQYRQNGNGSYFAYSGRSDIVYIPRKYSIKFQELAQIFYRNSVFLEIAIPTMLQFLAPSADISQLPGYYIPGDVRKNDPRVVDARYFWSTYFVHERTWFIHPFKLHHEADKNRELNLALMERILIRKTKEFIRTC